MRGVLPHEKVCTLGLSARGAGLDSRCLLYELWPMGPMGCPIFVHHHHYFLYTESKLARIHGEFFWMFLIWCFGIVLKGCSL